jgi:hypothetical protein
VSDNSGAEPKWLSTLNVSGAAPAKGDDIVRPLKGTDIRAKVTEINSTDVIANKIRYPRSTILSLVLAEE